MAFSKKTWKDRISEYPNRRIIDDGITTKVVTVGRDEGNVSEAGDAFNAENMNDLEERIYQATRNGGGGGGGTTDYDDLDNKPSINGVTLSGDKTTSDLGLKFSDLEGVELHNVQDGDVLTYDAALNKWVNKTPTGGGLNTNVFTITSTSYT